MKLDTVSRDLGVSIDEAQQLIDHNMVAYDLTTERYYSK